MKVKFVGFGGHMDTPCYEDEKGRLYFDENDGRNGLNLYTGAYRDECGEILGEPYESVTESVECDEPFVRHAREHDYMMLGRLQSDCKYFLGCGNGYEGHLYYKEVNKHCDEMMKLYDSFSESDRPEWLTAEQIEQYRKDMLNLLNPKKAVLVRKYAAEIIDLFERILDEHNITIPSEEDDQKEPDNAARLYGMVYAVLEDNVVNHLLHFAEDVRQNGTLVDAYNDVSTGETKKEV